MTVIEQVNLDIDGETLSIPVKVHKGARRLILRLDPRTSMPTVTCPPGVSARMIQRFVEDSRAWIAAEWLHRPPAQPLTGGMVLPLDGVDHRLVLDPSGPRKVRQDSGRLYVGGPADMAAKRLTTFFKNSAKARLGPYVVQHARALDVTPKAVRYTDTVSRWGSCSSTKIIRLNWRLVMAPKAVQCYVAAHEVAHLREMNHGPHFWTLVERLVGDWKPQRHWLKSEAARRLMTLPIGNGAKAPAAVAPGSVTK